MSMRYGIEAKVNPKHTTLSDMGRFVDEIRRYGVDEESEDYSLTYGGDVWISNLLKEQAIEIVKIMMLARMDIEYIYRYDPDGDDVDETVFDADDDSRSPLDVLMSEDISDNQTRLEDFDVSEEEV